MGVWCVWSRVRLQYVIDGLRSDQEESVRFKWKDPEPVSEGVKGDDS